jgi:hypothetical protein
VSSFTKDDNLPAVSAGLTPELILLFHRLTCFDLPSRAVGQLRTREVWLGNLISFYKLASGSFSLGPYRRTDKAPDIARDREMIEDAVYCISKALEKKSPQYGPVTVASSTTDRPKVGWQNNNSKNFRPRILRFGASVHAWAVPAFTIPLS